MIAIAGELLLAPTGQRLRMLQNTLQCTEQSPTIKNHLVQNVNSDEAEKPSSEGLHHQYITFMWNFKNGTNEPVCKTEIVTDVENKLVVNKKKGGEG